ncbi:MAG TPA: hypothetical protein VGL99_14475, partial [Chloroflexota bacterium]
LFHGHHPRGASNWARVNDSPLNTMLENQRRTLDHTDRKRQIFDIQRYLSEQMYYVPHSTSHTTWALQPNVRDFFPISDASFGAEVAPKLWLA